MDRQGIPKMKFLDLPKERELQHYTWSDPLISTALATATKPQLAYQVQPLQVWKTTQASAETEHFTDDDKSTMTSSTFQQSSGEN